MVIIPNDPTSDRRPTDKPQAHIGKSHSHRCTYQAHTRRRSGAICAWWERSRGSLEEHIKTSRRRPSPRWSRAIHVKATMPDNQGSWHYDIWWRDLVGDTIRMIPDRSMPSSSWQQYRTSNPEISLYTTPLIACKRKEYISDRGGNQI